MLTPATPDNPLPAKHAPANADIADPSNTTSNSSCAGLSSVASESSGGGGLSNCKAITPQNGASASGVITSKPVQFTLAPISQLTKSTSIAKPLTKRSDTNAVLGNSSGKVTPNPTPKTNVLI